MKDRRFVTRTRPIVAARLLAYGAVALVATLVLSSCGGYYYRATVQGFVVDDDSGAGINDATVRIYTEEVTDPLAPGYVAQTGTVTQGGNAGYYSSTVIWNNLFGAYGQEGDTTTIWISITHKDYGSVVVPAEGILSDESNLIATVRLPQSTFQLSALQGRVVDANGQGVDGVRVVLDLPVVSGTDDPEDRVTQTATIDGTSGTYRFTNVAWSDANTTSSAGELNATIRVNDPQWGDPTYAGTGPDDQYTIEKSVALVPSDQTRVVPSPFTVYRLPRTEFSTTVTGRLLERLTDTDQPVQGVRVELTFDQIDASGTPVRPFRTLVDYTDAQGTYVFNVSWTDLAPGDFDEASLDAAASPDPYTLGTAGIDPGEDGLLINVTYSDIELVPGTSVLKFSEGNVAGESPTFDAVGLIVSGARGGANRLPDIIKAATAP